MEAPKDSSMSSAHGINTINKNTSNIVINGGNANKGTGAGGAQTTRHGKLFEEKTNNYARLLHRGFVVKQCPQLKTKTKTPHFYLSAGLEDKTTIFTLHTGFKAYMCSKYKIDIFRHPDEAYIIECNATGKTVIKILEKKEQHVAGSVETKLWAGPSLKREYEIVLGDKFEVQYGFCINEYLQKKLTSNEQKYITLNQVLAENNIAVLFGDDANYFETLDKWVIG
jgi:hypothetical protein